MAAEDILQHLVEASVACLGGKLLLVLVRARYRYSESLRQEPSSIASGFAQMNCRAGTCIE